MLGTRRRAGFAAIVALLVLASSIAGAKDYCVTIDPVHSDVLIGLGFTIPSKGKCKHWNGLGTYGGVVNHGAHRLKNAVAPVKVRRGALSVSLPMRGLAA
jgi:hypothetical protein